jgi:superfamily II DNA/RNA helicase
MTFADLGLSPELLEAVETAGYTTPTAIQAEAIPAVLMMKDIIGIAQTGTGKTASFVLPMIDVMAAGRRRALMPRSLILEPTRELAAQVAENFEKYGANHDLKMALLIGGVQMGDQVKALNEGVDVLIATPGRLMDLFERGKILLNGCELLVIDEADRMLDMGFIPDIERICKLIPFTRQTLFFSATMPPEIQKLADKFLQNPARIEVAPPSSTAATVEQRLVACGSKDFEKRERLRDLIRSQSELTNAIIFCNRKKDVADLYKSLEKHGFSVGALHGDMDQRSRTNMLQGFKDNEITLLVASDVAARGLDIPAVSHVFNFDVPIHAEDYVHRIGRTGRAGRAGAAFTLVSRRDAKYVDAITKLIDREINWLDGQQAIENADPADDKPARGRRGESKSPARKTARGEKRAREDAVEPAAVAERAAETVEADKPVEMATAPKEAPRKDREERQPRQERESRAAPQRTPEPANANNDRNRGRNRRGGRDNDDREPTPVGFGDEIPAFMMIGS